MEISGVSEGVEKKVIETASDKGASGKEVELGEKEEHTQDVTERRKLLWKMLKKQD